jgi:hypothetical protein
MRDVRRARAGNHMAIRIEVGPHEDEDVRAAIATCLREDLLQYHFDLLFPGSRLPQGRVSFSRRQLLMCWKFGEATEPVRAASI